MCPLPGGMCAHDNQSDTTTMQEQCSSGNTEHQPEQTSHPFMSAVALSPAWRSGCPAWCDSRRRRWGRWGLGGRGCGRRSSRRYRCWWPRLRPGSPRHGCGRGPARPAAQPPAVAHAAPGRQEASGSEGTMHGVLSFAGDGAKWGGGASAVAPVPAPFEKTRRGGTQNRAAHPGGPSTISRTIEKPRCNGGRGERAEGRGRERCTSPSLLFRIY